MEIELRTNLTYFGHNIDSETIFKWKSFWRQLCDMAYHRKGVCEKLIVLPKKDSDAILYKSTKLRNDKDISFESVWKEYSNVGDVQKVPELKELYVPSDLFICNGIWSFMEYCFPNCKLIFWD